MTDWNKLIAELEAWRKKSRGWWKIMSRDRIDPEWGVTLNDPNSEYHGRAPTPTQAVRRALKAAKEKT